MLKISEKINNPATPSAILTLPFEKRQRSRLKVSLDNKQEAALILKRGSVLRHGDLLRADNGCVIEVRAANEEVAVVSTKDPILLAKACYHLGNRHIPLQVGDGWLHFQRDHVLEKMVQSLGLDVKHALAPFEPESGAYGEHTGHSHHS
ncbi:MAG TPA: urease accessory protein UreE [Nitrospinaceae bacterium]|jgi:urease accessory protein|nr:urease accessory protein UreE [Nitrospinaceae bacterium]